MSYVDSNLLTGEQVTFRAHLHWKMFVGPVALAVLALLFLVVSGAVGGILLLVALVLFGATYLHYRTSEFAVTNKRVIIKVGLIQRRSLEMLLSKVEAIGVDQGIGGRIFGYGTIVVTGTGGTHERFQNITDPFGFRRAVQEQTA